LANHPTLRDNSTIKYQIKELFVYIYELMSSGFNVLIDYIPSSPDALSFFGFLMQSKISSLDI
jgi:hypothetical protein